VVFVVYTYDLDGIWGKVATFICYVVRLWTPTNARKLNRGARCDAGRASLLNIVALLTRPEIARPPEIALRFSIFRGIDSRLNTLGTRQRSLRSAFLRWEPRILSLIATK
jgi:hypothetical protein